MASYKEYKASLEQNSDTEVEEETEETEGRGGCMKIGCLVVVILLVLILGVGGFFGLGFLNEVNGKNETDESVTVEIESGSGTAAMANALKEAGIIKTPMLFRQYVKQKGVDSNLQYGTFTLNKGASYDEIIEVLSATVAADTISLTFPEGVPAQYIADKMEEAGLCSAADFLDTANNDDFSQFKFWNERTTDENCFMPCEGYLYPNTYEFYTDDTVYNYVATFYAQFDSEITDELYARMEEQGMSLTDTVILASFVQEEAGNDQSAAVAGVFYNRLYDANPAYPGLQSNCCSYVQSDQDNNYLYNWVAPYYGGWDNIPQNIYENYDTYTLTTLPAGAISNPGYESLYAALYPEDNDYYFFVTDSEGNYYYAADYSTHLANCKKCGY